MPVLLIRPAQREDAQEMAKLHAECFKNGWRAQDFTAYLAKPDTYTCLVAHTDERGVVGFLCASRQADEAEILTLCVAERCRLKGAGRKLMAHALEDLKKQKMARLFLEVSQNNTAALRLYQSLGFLEVGRRPHYNTSTDGSRLDALVMKYSL